MDMLPKLIVVESPTEGEIPLGYLGSQDGDWTWQIHSSGIPCVAVPRRESGKFILEVRGGCDINFAWIGFNGWAAEVLLEEDMFPVTHNVELLYCLFFFQSP